MTTSQISFLSEILGDDPIPTGKLAYFRRRLSNRLHALVLAEFMRLEKAGKMTRAQLARRIGRRPEQVTRWLGSSGNWTIETLSDLLLAMRCEPALSLSNLNRIQTASDKPPSESMVVAPGQPVGHLKELRRISGTVTFEGTAALNRVVVYVGDRYGTTQETTATTSAPYYQGPELQAVIRQHIEGRTYPIRHLDDLRTIDTNV